MDGAFNICYIIPLCFVLSYRSCLGDTAIKKTFMYLCVQLNKEKAYLNLDVNKLYNLYIYIYRVGLELIVISKQGTFTIENSTQDVSLKKKTQNK